MAKKPRKKGKPVLMIFLLVLVALFVFVVVGMLAWSIRVNGRAENVAFVAGKMPQPALDGIYNGNTQTKSNWQGKRFIASDQSGLNIFEDGERYKFKTASAKSLSSDNQVLKLDYNQAGNPWWLRLIVDEISQVNDNEYQGKVYLKVGPLPDVPLTYFQLQKQ